jgi:tetratricopeptide (TPR) repeat protein
LLVLLLGVSGCGASHVASRSEVDEPYYREGDRLKRQGSTKEALGAFLRVIEKRGDDAPESHLEAGLLYQQYFKDPIAAIYHFRRYLDLQPNARQADLVRQRIDAAMRDFARTLPAQPLESQAARLELMNRIDELQRENLQLKEELAGRHPAVPEATGEPLVEKRVEMRTPSPPNASATVFFRLGSSGSPAAGAAGSAVRTPPASRATPAPAAAPAAASGRTHVVAAGESLYKIAQRYYGNGTRWPEILEANRDRLKNEGAVRVGMELRIP